MEPTTMAALAVGGSGLLSFKGNQAAAKAARQTAEYNAKVREQEAILLARQKVDQEAQLRKQGDMLVGQQRVATAKSGIQMSGSPLEALAATYFGIEEDALRIQYASKIEQTKAITDARLIRAEGRARSSAMRTQAYAGLLETGSKAATLMG